MTPPQTSAAISISYKSPRTERPIIAATPADHPSTISPFEIGSQRAYLTQLAQSAPVAHYKAAATAALDIHPGHTVVDLGCGAGVDLHRYAELTGPTGVVIGIDYDKELAAQAAQSSLHLRNVSVEVADVHHLPLQAASVDRVQTDRVLQHVASPSAAIAEAARILRATGRLVCTEPDWATLAIDHPNAELSRLYANVVSDHVIPNPSIGRSLPRLFQDAGLTVNRIEPRTILWTDFGSADQVLGLRVVTARAVEAGHLTAAQSQSWMDHLVSGPFLASMTLFTVSAHAAGDHSAS